MRRATRPPSMYLPQNGVDHAPKSHQARSTVPFHSTGSQPPCDGVRIKVGESTRHAGETLETGPSHWATCACTYPREWTKNIRSKKRTICDCFVNIDATITLCFGLASRRTRSSAGKQNAQLDDTVTRHRRQEATRSASCSTQRHRPRGAAQRES